MTCRCHEKRPLTCLHFEGKALDDMSDDEVEELRRFLVRRREKEREDWEKRGITTRINEAEWATREWLHSYDRRKETERAAAQASLLL